MKNKIIKYNFEFPDMGGGDQSETHNIQLFYEGYMIEYHYNSYYEYSLYNGDEHYQELSIKIFNNNHIYNYLNSYYDPFHNDEKLDKIINSFFGLSGLEEFKKKTGITNLIQEEERKVYG